MDLLILAAGLGTRFGGTKQLTPVGPGGEAILDFNVYDALDAGFERVVIVIRAAIEPAVRAHVARGFGRHLPVVYAMQDRPRGTGHAVWCARDAVGPRFVVMNADDVYGSDAIARAASVLEHLIAEGRGPSPWGLVGFPLGSTLPPAGCVSRSILSIEGDTLRAIEEVHHLAADTSRDALVSMNLWALTKSVMPHLEAAVLRHDAADPSAGDPKVGDPAEIMLPLIIGDAIDRGDASVRVVPTESRWCGMTSASDLDWVRARIAEAIAAGRYPRSLWS